MVQYSLGLLWNLFDIFHSSHRQMVKVISLANFIALVEFSIARSSSSGLMRNYGVWLLLATALCIINYWRVTGWKKKGERHIAAERLTDRDVHQHP